ncbi:DUF1240 domain-containing protein [Citrobacter braakii]|uniref:DUF1240 domain-containing protein n=1 Tax=Citrobacter TaxID=544 RepID=UPI0015E9D2A9|nr:MULTISPECIES: DUF1240 domain-containing protein [Citrobacter]MBM3063286.1 DUF1240 domain-containing protein [Citrobacter braakii]MBM3067903.1 DUF1240 domain-containing protein [Citrobacter braakii]QLS53355.1 DUF1240 domain-containing protein [Citrobacter sp. RHBSTW-00887]HEF0011059.1 DUF1240 domain-containing protein [Citrobacter braakii]
MQEFPFKRRVGMFFGMLCLYVPLILVGGGLSLTTLREYYEFPSELSFSSFFVYGFSAVFILTPVAFFSLWPIFLGRRVSMKVQKIVTKYMIAVFIVTVAFQVGFKIYFSNKLENKGYVVCPDTPKAWVPGMATRYAKDPQSCR